MAATGDRQWEAHATSIIDQFREVAHAHPLAFGLLDEAELWTFDLAEQCVITGDEQFVSEAKRSLATAEVAPLVTFLSGTQESLNAFPVAMEHPDNSVVICTQGTCTAPIEDAIRAADALAQVLSERAGNVAPGGS